MMWLGSDLQVIQTTCPEKFHGCVLKLLILVRIAIAAAPSGSQQLAALAQMNGLCNNAHKLKRICQHFFIPSHLKTRACHFSNDGFKNSDNL